jgi:hypothetical protein
MKGPSLPELRALDYFVGRWTSSGEMLPSRLGPGGQITLQEENEWMDGGYFVVLHLTFAIPDEGKGRGIAFMGYDPAERVYTYDEFNSHGDAIHSRGTLEGDTWAWTSQRRIAQQLMQTRFTMKILSPALYLYRFEISPDGKNWELVMEATDRKSSSYS